MSEVQRYSMTDPAVAACPHAYYAAMRREAPVHQDPGTGYWWVAKHDDVVAGAMNVDALSSKTPVLMRRRFLPRAQALWDAAGMEVIDTLVFGDPPEHEHYRAVGVQLFNPKKVEELAPRIETRCHELIDALGDTRDLDFVQAFATQLPASIVCDEFGFPREDQHQFKAWTDAYFGLMLPGLSEDQEVELVKPAIELFQYLARHIEKAATGPAGRVLHDMATMPRRDGTPFTMLERCWMTLATFVGGNDTTIGLLSGGMHRLASDPELQQQLRSDPALIPRFIEEQLRLEGSVQALVRVATRDIEIGGVHIPKGADVVLCAASANRDESRWPDADTFRLDRADGRRHLSFGQGIHTCMGMHLARRELQIAFDVLLRRWRDIRLQVPGSAPEHLPLPFHRAYRALPLRIQA